MEINDNTLGGTLWVNLLNTKRMIGGHVVDILEDTILFMKWLKDNEVILVDADSNYEYYIGKLKVLRGNFKVIIEAFLEEKSLTEIKALTNINKTLESIPAIISATYNDTDTTMEFHACDNKDELPLQIIHSFLNTCKIHGLGRVRQCAHEECILYFLDISKSGKRKWCSMETCGNRKKASKHYHKVKAPR